MTRLRNYRSAVSPACLRRHDVRRLTETKGNENYGNPRFAELSRAASKYSCPAVLRCDNAVVKVCLGLGTKNTRLVLGNDHGSG